MTRLPAVFLVAVFAWAQPADTVRHNYTKFEERIAMRDGKRLFTSIYIPKEVYSSNRKYPIMLQRTPYGVAPYGVDKYRTSLGPSDLFAKDGFIFVYQDVRGRNMSEGDWTLVRPIKPLKNSPQDTDESSDTFDTIDWLVKNLPGNTGKVGMWGVSQPGFHVSAGMIDAHPALVAASPQAPVTDYYLGDDSYHNGAFMLAHRFGSYQRFRERAGPPEVPGTPPAFDYGTPDGYDFLLRMGPLANAEEKFFKRGNPYWTMHMENTTYNQFWKDRSVWRHLKSIKPAVMVVGGWYDAEDPQGPLRTHAMIEKNSPPPVNMLVMGPWSHGGFARGDGEKLGPISFGSKTGVFYREQIEFPFFMHYLKGKGDGKFPRAWAFQTGVNEWRKFEVWPPAETTARSLWLDGRGKLTFDQPSSAAFDEYISDPMKPVPYIGHIVTGMRGDYMVEDQRFAAARPDVLVYEMEPLERDVTVYGPIHVSLLVSTTGTDSDFVVKLIDVYPNDYPNPSAARPATPGTRPPPEPANTIKLGGYQQLVRGEPFRGKFRRGMEQTIAFEPGKPDRIEFTLPDIAHTFRAGHRIMVQVQSSWFPLIDRNPQKFLEIPKARSEDFIKATQRVYRGGVNGSRLTLPVAR